jgi:hypothetical protein
MKIFSGRAALTFMIAFSVTVPAFAIERINTPQTDCAAIQSIIQRDGAAILRYPSERVANYTLYDRYVTGDRFCRRDERAEPASVPSADRARCRVLLCEPYEPIIELFD